VTSGVATFSSLNVNLANSYTFTPSTNVAGVTTLPVSGSFTVSAASASTIAVNDGDSQSATAGTAVTTPPSVIVKDQFGNVVSGVSVTFAVGLGGGTVVPTTAITTDAGGIARVTSWTLGSTPGANTLTATSGSLSGSPVTFNATGL
jgi:adhesin/invasin